MTSSTESIQSPAVPSSSAGPIRRWIVEHDDNRLFLFGYVVISIVLTIWVGLFWLLVMVALHFGLECIKKQHDGAGRLGRVAAWALWDIKLDLVIVAMALMLLMYTSVSVGVAGAAGLSRMTLFGFRFGGISGLAAIPKASFKNLVLASRMVCARKIDRREIKKRRAMFELEGVEDCVRARRIASAKYPWQARWTFVDRAAVVLVVLNLAAFAAGFFLAQEPPREVLQNLAAQLHPWPYQAPIDQL